MKFKVWDSKNKEWSTDKHQYFIDQWNKLYVRKGNFVHDCEDFLIPVLSTVINGVEFYDGDIFDRRGTGNTFKFVVIIHENEFKIKYVGGYLNNLKDTLYDQTRIFKIGNKFENHELLT